MIKRFFIIPISLILLLVCVLPVSADTLSCYANTDPESTTVGLLVNAMRSDPAYDPFNQYVVCRTSDNQYVIAFGPDLQSGATLYVYTQQYAGVPARISKSSASSISVNSNGYYYAGNAFDGITSTRAETYKYQSVVVVAVIVILLVVLFKVFKRSSKTKMSYYAVR